MLHALEVLGSNGFSCSGGFNRLVASVQSALSNWCSALGRDLSGCCHLRFVVSLAGCHHRPDDPGVLVRQRDSRNLGLLARQ